MNVKIKLKTFDLQKLKIVGVKKSQIFPGRELMRRLQDARVEHGRALMRRLPDALPFCNLEAFI